MVGLRKRKKIHELCYFALQNKKKQKASEAAPNRAARETTWKGTCFQRRVSHREGGDTAVGYCLPHSQQRLDVSDLLPPLLAEALLSSVPSDRECPPEEWEGNTKGG